MNVTATELAQWGRTAVCGSILEICQDDDLDGALRVSLLGEVDIAVTDELVDRLGRLVQLQRLVRLDLSQLRFIDGRGLATLAGAIIQARAGGIDVEVDRIVTPAVRRVVALTDLASMLWPEPRSMAAVPR